MEDKADTTSHQHTIHLKGNTPPGCVPVNTHTIACPYTEGRTCVTTYVTTDKKPVRTFEGIVFYVNGSPYALGLDHIAKVVGPQGELVEISFG